MDKRLFVQDNDFVRAAGYETGRLMDDGSEVIYPVNFTRVAAFVLNMNPKSRVRDQRKPHWKFWGYDLI